MSKTPKKDSTSAAKKTNSSSQASKKTQLSSDSTGDLENLSLAMEPTPTPRAAPPPELLDEDDDDLTVETEEEIVLTDAEGNRYCRARDCDQIAGVDVYCRFHYLLFWKKIQVRKKILADGKLERYVEELTSRYPDKFLEMIRRDLRTEKDFVAAIQELEIDESGLDNEYEEDTQSYLDEVRGMGGGEGDSVEDDF